MTEEIKSIPDGLTANPAVDPAARLLIDAPIENGKKLLIVEGGCGKLAVHFHSMFDQVINQNIFFQNHTTSQDELASLINTEFQNLLEDLPRAGQSEDFAEDSFDEFFGLPVAAYTQPKRTISAVKNHFKRKEPATTTALRGNEVEDCPYGLRVRRKADRNPVDKLFCLKKL